VAGQPAGGARPMRDPGLVGRRLLAERPATDRLPDRLEDRVVAEAAPAARPFADPATKRAPRLGRDRQATSIAGMLGQDKNQDAHVAGAPGGRRQAGQGVQQLGVVLEVGRVLARIAPGPDAGGAVERVDLDPRVVGDRREAGQASVEAGLQAGIGLERGAVLDRVAGQPQRVEADELGSVRLEQLGQLGQLVARAGRDDNPGPLGREPQRRTPASASACAPKRRSRPVPARSSRLVRAARSNGLPSAVPCSST